MLVHASSLSALDMRDPENGATGEQANAGSPRDSEVLHDGGPRDRWFRYGPRKRQAAGARSGDPLSPLSDTL